MRCSVQRQKFSCTPSFGRALFQKNHKMPKQTFQTAHKSSTIDKLAYLDLQRTSSLPSINYILTPIPCAPLASSFLAGLLCLQVPGSRADCQVWPTAQVSADVTHHVRMQIRQLFSFNHPSLRGMSTTSWFCPGKNKHQFIQLKTRPEQALLSWHLETVFCYRILTVQTKKNSTKNHWRLHADCLGKATSLCRKLQTVLWLSKNIRHHWCPSKATEALKAPATSPQNTETRSPRPMCVSQEYKCKM